jgi:hypothetical protein
MSIYSECGHEYHGNHCAKCAREAGAAEERAKIVAWLMREEEGYPSSEYSGFAAMIRQSIEAKEHLK